jgi:circadian clock protein KaiA
LTARFLVGIFTLSDSVAESLRRSLSRSPFVISWSNSEIEFMDWVVSNRHRIDCLLLQQSGLQQHILDQLSTRDILLPTLIINALESDPADPSTLEPSYHNAVISVGLDQLESLENDIQKAIDRFLKLPTQGDDAELLATAVAKGQQDNQLFLLSLQQQRLAEKLQERLGYLGVYYKRNPQNFLRNMTVEERHEFVDKLRQDYRHIILNYFANESGLNQRIDDFVNLAFFADVSVSKIVEIHMELMDDFSKQLHLEGRSEEILLDYRLTLIDVIAHLCEMYRRSIPRDM